MQERRAYITFAGRSVWALLNTYHAVLREGVYAPTDVSILMDAACRSSPAGIVEGIGIISERYGISPRISTVDLPCGDYAAAGEAVLRLAERLCREGSAIALDITPGRKAAIVSACTALASAGIAPAHIYYLGLLVEEGMALPYPMIPLHLQPLHDLAGGRA